MVEQNFTTNLVSNASMDVFPANTMARLTTLLPNKVELTGDWEVALLEVSWPEKSKTSQMHRSQSVALIMQTDH